MSQATTAPGAARFGTSRNGSTPAGAFHRWPIGANSCHSNRALCRLALPILVGPAGSPVPDYQSSTAFRSAIAEIT